MSSDAKSYGVIVFISPQYQDDEGLIIHELTHCRQFYRTLGLHPILYKFSKKYRYKAEIEAYSNQLIEDGVTQTSINYVSKLIKNNYDLKVYESDVRYDITNKVMQLENKI